MNRIRRRLLQAIGGAGAACLGFGGVVRDAYGQQTERLAKTELGNGLFLVTGAGGNVVVVPGPESLLMVDSGSSERARDIESLVSERFASAPLELLFNTHWHVDHTGGNEILARPDTVIVAHENTRLWMSTKFYVEWEDRHYPRRAAEALPNKTFFSSYPQPIEMAFAGETVIYAHLREAHTDGDIYVWFPDRNVIVAGGVVTAGSYPLPDYITGGWVGGLIDATQTLIDMADSSTLIVPAAGSPRSRSDLVAQHEMLSTVRERIEAMALTGKGIDEMVAAGITKEFDARFGNNAELFISNVYQGLWWGNRLRGIVA